MVPEVKLNPLAGQDPQNVLEHRIAPNFPENLNQIHEVPIPVKESSEKLTRVADDKGSQYWLKQSKTEGHVWSEFQAYKILQSLRPHGGNAVLSQI